MELDDAWIVQSAQQDVVIEQLQREMAATVHMLDSARVLQLLTHSQEEASAARRELVTVRLEVDRLSDQATLLRRQISRLRDDNAALQLSIQNSAAHLRTHGDSLVVSEMHKGRAAARVRELADAVAAAEARARQVHGDLAVATADLRATRAYTESMEARMTDLSTSKAALAQVASGRGRLLGNNSVSCRSCPIALHPHFSPLQSKLQGKFDTMEQVANELSQRAELAERKLAALMAASGIALKPGGAEPADGGGAGAGARAAAVQQAVEEGVLLTRESIDKVEQFLRTLPDDINDPPPAKAARTGKLPPKKGGTKKGPSATTVAATKSTAPPPRPPADKAKPAASKPSAPPTAKPTAAVTAATATAAKTTKKPAAATAAATKTQGITGRAISNGSLAKPPSKS